MVEGGIIIVKGGQIFAVGAARIKSGKKVAEGAVDEFIAASGQRNLEDAYLVYMGEKELL